MAVFGDLKGKVLNDTLLKYTGVKFGAKTSCFPGVGGIQPLRDRLVKLRAISAEDKADQSTIREERVCARNVTTAGCNAQKRAQASPSKQAVAKDLNDVRKEWESCATNLTGCRDDSTRRDVYTLL